MEQQTYVARYEIRHGVTHGFGIVYDDESTERREFGAGSIEDALKRAVDEARQLAQDYIAAPSGKTTVLLRELCEKDGKVIDVFAELKSRLPPERFDLVKGLLFPDGTHYTCSASWIDHALAIEKEQKRQSE